MNRIRLLFARILKGDSGQNLAKYAIIAALIALMLILAVPRLRSEADNILFGIGNQLQ